MTKAIQYGMVVFLYSTVVFGRAIHDGGSFTVAKMDCNGRRKVIGMMVGQQLTLKSWTYYCFSRGFVLRNLTIGWVDGPNPAAHSNENDAAR